MDPDAALLRAVRSALAQPFVDPVTVAGARMSRASARSLERMQCRLLGVPLNDCLRQIAQGAKAPVADGAGLPTPSDLTLSFHAGQTARGGVAIPPSNGGSPARFFRTSHSTASSR